MDARDAQWYRALDHHITSTESPHTMVMDRPALPMSDQLVTWTASWFADRFFPLDGHWCVRWTWQEGQGFFRLWLVQNLAGYAPFAPVTSSTDTFGDPYGVLYWAPATDGSSVWTLIWQAPEPIPIASAHLDAEGLVAVEETPTWQAALIPLITAVPPAQWTVLPPAPRPVARWIIALVISAAEVVPLVGWWLLFSRSPLLPPSPITPFLRPVYNAIMVLSELVMPFGIWKAFTHHDS